MSRTVNKLAETIFINFRATTARERLRVLGSAVEADVLTMRPKCFCVTVDACNECDIKVVVGCIDSMDMPKKLTVKQPY